MPEKISKRIILENIAKLYDPNGFISPVIVKAKMLMQDIWRLKRTEKYNGKPQDSKKEWDKKVPIEIKTRYLELYEDLPLLKNTSEKAYSVVIYVRTINSNGKINCSLLSSKSRIAPIKEVSIPRLELLAAVMLSEQLEAILNACDFKANSVTLWSDSSIVLYWLKKQPHELKAFVGNRVANNSRQNKEFQMETYWNFR